MLQKKTEVKKVDNSFPYTFVHALSTDLAIIVMIIIMLIMITSLTEENSILCVHKEIEKGTKERVHHTAKKRTEIAREIR